MCKAVEFSSGPWRRNSFGGALWKALCEMKNEKSARYGLWCLTWLHFFAAMTRLIGRFFDSIDTDSGLFFNRCGKLGSCLISQSGSPSQTFSRHFHFSFRCFRVNRHLFVPVKFQFNYSWFGRLDSPRQIKWTGVMYIIIKLRCTDWPSPDFPQ